jgi:hypothetical protein
MRIKVRYAHLEFDEVELDVEHVGDIDDLNEDEVLEVLEKQQGLGEDNETEIVNIEGVIDTPPTIIDYQVELDDSAISVEWSSGKFEDVDPETVLKWLAAGERASRVEGV